jgi:hypothetical protein
MHSAPNGTDLGGFRGLAEEGSEGQVADSLDIQAVVLDQLHVQVTSELVRHITEIYELFLDTQTTPQPFRYPPSYLHT